MNLKCVKTILFLTVFCVAGSASARDIWGDDAGRMFVYNYSGKADKTEISLDEAKSIVRNHRWVYVNSSLKDLGEAKAEAHSLAKKIESPMVLVYCPRQLFVAHDRNTYPAAFQKSLRSIVKAAMEKNQQLLVTAKSYGVHQTLRVLMEFNNPNIILTGISPAFGIFGHEGSANVKQYVKDIKATKNKYCPISSEDDGFTWKAGGAAYKRHGRKTYRGSKNVGKAIEANSSNVKLVRLEYADHVMRDYLEYGLTKAMRQCSYIFNMHDTPLGRNTSDLGNPISGNNFRKETCQKWCQNKSNCNKCTDQTNCGAGSKVLKSWRGRGKNYFACENRSSATKDNKQSCKDWCSKNKKCKKCSTNRGCGRGYKHMKSWTGYGRNYHACRKR